MGLRLQGDRKRSDRGPPQQLLGLHVMGSGLEASGCKKLKDSQLLHDRLVPRWRFDQRIFEFLTWLRVDELEQAFLLQHVISAHTCSCCHGDNARTGHWSSGPVRDRDGRWNWDHVCRVLLQHDDARSVVQHGGARLLVSAYVVQSRLRSCYDMTSHVISCDVPETSCSSPNMWYAPGYVSPRSGCCHCRASCKEPTDNCTYNDAEVETQRNWGCYDSSTNACECDTTEAECVGSWTQSCRSCNGEVSTSSAGRPRGFVLALLVLLYGFFAAEANTGSGTGCYNVETHQCDCTVSESTCHARGGTWTDTCRSCDSTTNEQHPQCQRQYSWGCFNEASHACECTVSERTCEAAAGKTWTHECWSCCHGSSWGCFVPGNGPESGCHCNLHETSCSLDFPDATWSHQCFDCDVDAETSAAGRPTGFVVALLALLSGFFLADANTGTGTGCYDTETHRCDCTVTETVCLARQGHWTDTCRSCDATTNEQHPDCQRQYSWGCFDEASHACECTVSERACDAAAGKTWTHECWSCCHGSAWGCFVPGNGPEFTPCSANSPGSPKKLELQKPNSSIRSGSIWEGSLKDATWSHQCFECEEDSVQKDVEAAMDDGGVGLAVAVSVSVTVVVIAACIGIYCLWAKMIKPKPVNEPYNSPQFNQSLDVGGILLQHVILAHTCSCCHGDNARTGHWSSGHVRDRDGRWNWDRVCRVLLQHATQARKSFRHFGGNLYEGACALDFPDATWSHQCFECEEDAVQKDGGAAVDDGGVGVAVAVSVSVTVVVSVSVTVVVIAACIGIYCLWAKMMKPKPVNEPYNSRQFNQSDVVVGLAVPGSAPSPAATPKEVA
eukprot:s2119_g6.t4